MELFSVDGKSALVTGGSRGIGFMMARGLVQAGAHVFITSRKADSCVRAAKELSKLGMCTPIPADVADASAVKALREVLQAQQGELQILINNAGTSWVAPLEDYPIAGWDKVLNLNLRAPFYVTAGLLPLLRKGAKRDDPARVINVGSIDGLHVPRLNTWAYSSSKAGLHMLTKHLAGTLASDNILVNAIAPGWVWTDLTDPLIQKHHDEMKASIPLQRFGSDSDMIGICIFLCSRASAYISGAIIPVDGGVVSQS